MKNALLFLFLLLICHPAHASDDYLLKGSIGKYQVVFDLFMSGNQIEATYFYTSTCIDIVLKGERTNDGVVLYASRTNSKTSKEDTTETWRLKENTNKSWTGTWSNNKGKRYDIVLQPVDINTIKNPYAQLPVVKEFKDGNPYNYVRSSLLPVVKDTNTTKNGKYMLRYYHLKNSTIEMFQIEGGLDKAIAEKANNVLRNKFIENAWNYCGCTGADTPDYNYELASVYITDNVLSININVEYYCNQAAHPDGGDDPVTIDMKTGKELTLNEVLYLTPVGEPDPKSDKWIKYSSEVYAPKLLALLKKTYPKQMVASDDCDYSQSFPWEFPKWYINKDGLYLAPSFPHAQAPCRNPDWSFISFELLKKYKNPKKSIVLP